jgi:hypothetical protein
MINFLRPVLVALIFVVPVVSLASTSSLTETERHAAGLAWNLRRQEAPFVKQSVAVNSAFAGPLTYQSEDFSFPLLQTLSFDSATNCYSLMVQRSNNVGLELINLWSARAGFYRSGNGPYFELENLDSLKSLTSLNGTKFIFAQVGDGEWHCVSVHDAQGNYLMIDYRANGLMARLRDSFGRTATPVYSDGRLVALTQIWTSVAGERIKTTALGGD